MKDRVVTAALAIGGFALTLAYVSWRDGEVWFANPFPARNDSADVQPLQKTASQKLQLPAAAQKAHLPAPPDPQIAATPAVNPADEPARAIEAPEAPAYESQVDRDEESGHASRQR